MFTVSYHSKILGPLELCVNSPGTFDISNEILLSMDDERRALDVVRYSPQIVV